MDDEGRTTSTDDTTATTSRRGTTGTTARRDTTETAVLTAARSAVTTKVVTASEFRARLSELLELANHQPVTIASRGARARGVLVNSDFFERACDALGEAPYARPPRSRLEEIMEETAQILEFL